MLKFYLKVNHKKTVYEVFTYMFNVEELRRAHWD